jgi:hypothetical protein
MDWFNENVLAAGARLLGTRPVEGRRPGVIDGVHQRLGARMVGRWPAWCAWCRPATSTGMRW